MPSVRTDSQPIAAANRVASASANGTASHHGQPRLIGGIAAGAEDGHQIAGDAGDRHLRQRHHAAVAAEEGERQRDQAERQRLRTDLEGEERRSDEGIGEQQGGDHDVARSEPAAAALAASVGIRLAGRGAAGS